jgi:hypothetical protein
MMIGSRLKFGAAQGQKRGEVERLAETRNAKPNAYPQSRYEQQAHLQLGYLIGICDYM